MPNLVFFFNLPTQTLIWRGHHMRFLRILVILLLASVPAYAGSQPRAPLTSGAAIHLTATNLGTTQATVLASDTNRGFLQIQNVGSSNNLACTLDGTAPVINGNGIQLSPLSAVFYDTFVPTGAVTCIGSAASTAYSVTYLP